MIQHPFLKELVQLESRSQLFSTRFVTFYLQYKWDFFGKSIFYKNLILFIIVYSLMLLEALYFSPFHRGELNVYRILSHILLLILSRRQHILWISTVWLVLLLDWTEGDK